MTRHQAVRARVHAQPRDVIIAITAFVALGSVLGGCDREPEPQPSGEDRRPRNVRRDCAGEDRLSDACRRRVRPPIAIIYLEGTAVVTEDLRGHSREFTDLATAEVAASTSGRHIAYVAGSPLTLNIYTPATDTRIAVGPGTDPVWSQTEDRLAWLRPSAPCEGEDCVPEGEIVAREVGSEEERVLLESGSWRILGWAGDSLHVVNPTEPDHIVVAEWTGAGKPIELPVPLSEYWGASPDGEWVLVVRGDGIEFLEFKPRRGTVASTGYGGTGRPAEGAWAPDSSQVAAVFLGKQSAVGLLSPRDPEPQYLQGSGGATGNVVWSTDSSAFAFVRVDPNAKGKLQAVYCTADDLDCRPLFSWWRGVRLLGFR